MYLSGIDDFPELDLQEMMDRIFDNYPGEFRDFWGLDKAHVPEDMDVEVWERHKELDRLAKRIAELAAALVRPRRLPEPDLTAPREMRQAAASAREEWRKLIDEVRTKYPQDKELIRTLQKVRLLEDVQYRFFEASLQLYLVEYLIWPGNLAARVVRLTDYAARVKSNRAIQYLGRVSRCYLYEMAPELAVMARATVEAVLEDMMPEEQVRNARRIPGHLRVGLSDYIEVAAGTLLSYDDAKSARFVKQAGDDAVHVSTEAVKDMDAILEQLVNVLEGLGKGK